MRVLLMGGGDLAEEVCEALEAGGADVRLAARRRRRRGAGRAAGGATRRGRAWPRARTRSRCGWRCSSATRRRRAARRDDLRPGDGAAGARDDPATARVTSVADIVAPTLAGPCLDPDLVAVRRAGDRFVGLDAALDEVRAAGDAGAAAAQPRRGRVRALRPQRGAALLRRDRARGDAAVRVDRLDDRARPGRRRRAVRLDQVAGDGRAEPGGRRRAEVVQGHDRRVDAADAAVGGVLHRRADQPARRLAPDRAARPPRGAAARSRGRRRPRARSGCGCACCCASAACRSWRSTPRPRARTSASRGG